MTLLETLRFALIDPLRYFLMPQQRLFWAYLIGALTLAIAYRVHSGRDASPGVRGIVTWLFPRRIWLHPSAILDYQLIFFKALIKALWFVPFAGSAFVLAAWTAGQLVAIFGDPGVLEVSRNQVRLLYTVSLFVCWDFSRFVVHKAAHRIPALWELHKVHHSAEVMTPLTLYRSHPIESFIFMIRGVVVTGILTGVFFHLFHTDAIQYDLFGVNALGVALNVLGGNLRHSHVRLRYPAWLERIFISPAQHQIHHSRDPRHFHQNCGAWLAIWDWMFGSLLLSRDARPRAFGLPPEELNHRTDGLLSSVLRPTFAAISRLPPRRSVSPSTGESRKSKAH